MVEFNTKLCLPYRLITRIQLLMINGISWLVASRYSSREPPNSFGWPLVCRPPMRLRRGGLEAGGSSRAPPGPACWCNCDNSRMTERDSRMVDGARDGDGFEVLDDDDSDMALSISVCLMCSRFAFNRAIRLVPNKYSRNFCKQRSKKLTNIRVLLRKIEYFSVIWLHYYNYTLHTLVPSHAVYWDFHRFRKCFYQGMVIGCW